MFVANPHGHREQIRGGVGRLVFTRSGAGHKLARVNEPCDQSSRHEGKYALKLLDMEKAHHGCLFFLLGSSPIHGPMMLLVGVISMSGLPGVIMIGVGVAPSKVPQETQLQFSKMGAVWSTLSGVNLKTELFFPFIGVCKIIGVAGMWGLFGDTAEVARCWRPSTLSKLSS